MSEYSFGYISNGQVCSCGRHHGCGEISPEARAARAKHMQRRLESLMSPQMKAYLTDWEKHHGIVVYHMAVVGRTSGKNGKDVLGAVFGLAQVPENDLFQQRADING